jgi:hypothetical protein
VAPRIMSYPSKPSFAVQLFYSTKGAPALFTLPQFYDGNFPRRL